MVDTQTRLIKSPGRWSQSGRVFLHVMGCRLAATPTARRGPGVKINTVRWGRSTERGKCCSVVLPTGSIPSWRIRSLANRPTVPGSAEVVIHKSAALSDPDAPVMGRYGVAGPSLERVPIRHPTPLCSVTQLARREWPSRAHRCHRQSVAGGPWPGRHRAAQPLWQCRRRSMVLDLCGSCGSSKPVRCCPVSSAQSSPSWPRGAA